MMQHAKQHEVVALVALTVVAFGALPAAAQTSAGPGAERITATAQFDVANAYSFRGLQQDDTGVILWPQVRVGARLYAADGPFTRLTLHARSWNSVHSGISGSDGPSGRRWYESDASAGVTLGLARGVNVDATYTAYTSPNEMFSTVKEVSFALDLDDRVALGRLLRPYALFAFELDASTGMGQADGGFEAGKYLEVGAAPQFSVRALNIAIPVKVGLSLGGYYELAGRDHTFGYFSTSGVVTVPIGGRATLGAWNVHGGVEYQALGEMTKAINGGDRSKVIGSIGIGWSR